MGHVFFSHHLQAPPAGCALTLDNFLGGVHLFLVILSVRKKNLVLMIKTSFQTLKNLVQSSLKLILHPVHGFSLWLAREWPEGLRSALSFALPPLSPSSDLPS